MRRKKKKGKKKHPHVRHKLPVALPTSGVDRCQRTEWLSTGESVCGRHFDTA